MYEVLIREAAARFGLGDKALQVLQMLLAYMTAKERGGLVGFLEKFKAAGLGPVIQSWLGGGPSAQAISNSQIETVLGSSGGLLSLITERVDLDRDSVASALGYLLPAIVGRLTPGGSIASVLPPEVIELAQAGETWLAGPVKSAQVAGSGGLMKWLPWVVVALAVVFGLSYLGRGKSGEAPATQASSEAAPEAAPSAPVLPPPAEPAATPAASGAPAPVQNLPPAPADEPAGAAVQALQVDGQPAINVYFESGKTEVDAMFGTVAADLIEHLKARADARVVISGFNDSTGDAVANAKLSKDRALAVQAALVAAGVEEGRTELLKPLDAAAVTAGDGNANARRVEVRLAP